MDTLYAQPTHSGYETWTYSDGRRVWVRRFASMEGLHFYAKRYGYRLIYVD